MYDTPDRIDVARGRVQTRCPHCHHRVEIVEGDTLRSINCPSCGNSFSLVPEETTRAYHGGKTVGHFELIDQLGIGHFGSVWMARDTQLDRTVALKIPRQEHLDETETETFFREARAAAQLQHPNIVTVHEVGRDEEIIYIVSDYVRGATLREWLSGQRLNSREAAELCIRLAHALHHAHEVGVIHRDLKPGNIMMDVDGEPHIMDFGLAKREAGEITMTVEGAVLGTPGYMSPEQARGEGHHVDRRCDVYSLGVVLYELLTGELPFRGEPQMLVVQILKDEPARPRNLNNHVPRDLETICLKLLEKNPAERYQTALAVADDLDRWLKGEPIKTRPISRPARVWRWCRRKPIVAGLTAAIILSLVAGLTMSLSFAFIAIEARDTAVGLAKKEGDARAEATRQLYVAQMNLAQRAWDENNVGRVREILEGQMPQHTGGVDLRGWEWRYLWRLSQSQLRALKFTSLCLAFTPDGQLLVSGSDDGILKMWNAAGTREVRTIKAHDGRISQMACDSEGTHLVTRGRYDGTIKLWEIATGRAVRAVPGKRMALSADGRRLASATTNITIWDAASGQVVKTLPEQRSLICGLAFSPDGTRLASGSWDAVVKLWDLKTGREIWTFAGHEDRVEAVAFSPNGRVLVSGSRDGTIKSWDMETGQESTPFGGHPSKITKLAFSPDGKRLVSSSDDSTLKIWEAATRRELHTLRGHSTTVTDVAFSPSGRVIASGSWDGTIRLWDAASRQEPWSLEHPIHVSSVTYSSDGRYLAGRSVGEITVWDASSGQKLWTDGKREVPSTAYVPKSLRFRPESRIVAWGLADGSVQYRDAQDGRILRTFKAHAAGVTSLDFSPDGRILATGGHDRHAALWNATDGRRLTAFKGHTDSVTNVVFCPDGRLVASAGEENDKQVRLWEVSTGREVRTFFDEGAVWSVLFSRDGRRIIAGGVAGMIRVWNVETGRTIRVQRGHSGGVTCLSLSADGRRFASSSDDGTVKIWDFATGQEVYTLNPDAGVVYSVAFSPDASRVAAGCAPSRLLGRPGHPGSVAVWDARPLTTDLRAELVAADLVDSLFTQYSSKKDVIERLEADTTITDSVRQRAVELAQQGHAKPISTE